eukprot:10062096-Alexandrium_andersonii.AAC.1
MNNASLREPPMGEARNDHVRSSTCHNHSVKSEVYYPCPTPDCGNNAREGFRRPLKDHIEGTPTA